MRMSVRSMLVLIAAGGLGVAACGDGGGDPTGTDTAQIVVTVLVDGDGEGGITVRLYAQGGTTALEEEITNSSGRVTFGDLDPEDAFEVEVEVPSSLELESGEARQGVTVTPGQSSPVTFTLVTPLPANVALVTLQGSSFSPNAVTIDAGMTIRWVNGGPVTHTITPDGHSSWSSQTVSTEGQTFEHTFNNAGSFPYLCQLHAGMTGTITVN